MICCNCRNPRFNHDKRIKNWLKTRDPMGERNPLVKSHIPGDNIHEKIIGFLTFFFFFASNFLCFDLMIWLEYVLIMFLGLNLLNSYDLGSKRPNIGFKPKLERLKRPLGSFLLGLMMAKTDSPSCTRHPFVGSVVRSCSTSLY